MSAYLINSLLKIFFQLCAIKNIILWLTKLKQISEWLMFNNIKEKTIISYEIQNNFMQFNIRIKRNWKRFKSFDLKKSCQKTAIIKYNKINIIWKYLFIII